MLRANSSHHTHRITSIWGDVLASLTVVACDAHICTVIVLCTLSLNSVLCQFCLKLGKKTVAVENTWFSPKVKFFISPWSRWWRKLWKDLGTFSLNFLLCLLQGVKYSTISTIYLSKDFFFFLADSVLNFNSAHSFPVSWVFFVFWVFFGCCCLWVGFFFFFLMGGCGLTKLAYVQLSICLETVPRGTLCRVLEVLHGIAHFPGVLSPTASTSLGNPQFWSLHPLHSETCVLFGVACLRWKLESACGQTAWAVVRLMLWFLSLWKSCAVWQNLHSLVSYSTSNFSVGCGRSPCLVPDHKWWQGGESCILNSYLSVFTLSYSKGKENEILFSLIFLHVERKLLCLIPFILCK